GALRAQSASTPRLLSGLSEAQAMHRYAAGKWSVKEVVGHITDGERVFSYRALRIARADTTPLPGFDEEAWVPAAHFDRRPLPDLVADYQTVRAATVALFEPRRGRAHPDRHRERPAGQRARAGAHDRGARVAPHRHPSRALWPLVSASAGSG